MPRDSKPIGLWIALVTRTRLERRKQGLEFRIVVNARQVGIDAGPIDVGVAGFFVRANHH